jgi:hypothetical protein
VGDSGLKFAQTRVRTLDPDLVWHWDDSCQCSKPRLPVVIVLSHAVRMVLCLLWFGTLHTEIGRAKAGMALSTSTNAPSRPLARVVVTAAQSGIQWLKKWVTKVKW